MLGAISGATACKWIGDGGGMASNLVDYGTMHGNVYMRDIYVNYFRRRRQLAFNHTSSTYGC